MKRKLEIENKTKGLFANRVNNNNLLKRTSAKDFDHFTRNPQRNSFEQENNFLNIISGFCSLIKTKKTLTEVYKSFNFYASKLGYEFTAICAPNEKKETLIVKTFDKETELNSFQFPFSDEYNYLIQNYFDKSRKFTNHKNLFSINCSKNLEYLMIPLVSQEESLGLVIVGFKKKDRHKDESINLLCNYLALLISNHNFKEDLSLFNNSDSLTGLYSHRKFQEKLTQILKKTEDDKEKASALIFDIDNISEINRKFGRSKGDEVISFFAKQIKSQLGEKDVAARYGSDEIAVIMPETDNETARKLAEKIIFNISKNEVPKVGKIKVHVGIATYPTSAADQEKLLVFAEQSMLISKNRDAKKGASSVLSSKDIDFWNKTALDSLSKVINRRNLNHKFNFEDELVKRLHCENKTSKISLEVVTSLAAAIDAKDTYTRGHSQAVSNYAEALAKAIELDSQTVEQIKLGAILHDIGKIGISETILRKPGPLTDHEWEVMKQHPIIGVKKILEPIESLQELISTVRHHHERIDGFGYPDRLKGNEIPLGAKIVAIADSFHALISHRPYKKAVSVKKALEILKSGAGKQWDKYLVEKFIMITPVFFLNPDQ